MAHQLEVKELGPWDAGALQAVYATVPGYFGLFGGLTDDEAEKALRDSPGVGESHHRWGLFREGELIGQMDFLLGHPDPRTAYLGLLLVRGDLHGQGIGRAAFSRWVAWVAAGPFERVVLGVAEGNEPAFAFWKACGLVDTGERKLLSVNGVTCRIHLLELRF